MFFYWDFKNKKCSQELWNITICKFEGSFPCKLAPSSICQWSNQHVYDWVTHKACACSSCTYFVYYQRVDSPALTLGMEGMMKQSNNCNFILRCVMNMCIPCLNRGNDSWLVVAVHAYQLVKFSWGQFSSCCLLNCSLVCLIFLQLYLIFVIYLQSCKCTGYCSSQLMLAKVATYFRVLPVAMCLTILCSIYPCLHQMCHRIFNFYSFLHLFRMLGSQE